MVGHPASRTDESAEPGTRIVLLLRFNELFGFLVWYRKFNIFAKIVKVDNRSG